VTDVSSVEGAPRRATRKLKPAGRSKVGNGKVLIAGIGTHTREYREYRDAVADLVEHLGSDPTAVQRAIIEEAAGLVVWCRNARLSLLKGDDFDIGKYTTATNALRRLLADIGKERRLKDVTPTLAEYLASKHQYAKRTNKTAAETSPAPVEEIIAISGSCAPATFLMAQRATLMADVVRMHHLRHVEGLLRVLDFF